MWWSNNDQRKQQKEIIKNIIKRTKLSEKTTHVGPTDGDTPPGLTHSLPTSATYSDLTPRTRAPSIDSQYSVGGYDGCDFSQPHIHDQFDPYPAHQLTPPYEANLYQSFHPAPYEVDIKTERQTYVNDVPTRKDSTTSTFSTFHPPPSLQPLTSFLDDEWIHGDIYGSEDMFSAEEGLNFNFFDFSHGAPQTSPQALIQVEDCDRPLLDHFIDNVLRLIFPILEVNQHGSARSEVILPALESNKCYLHCCLSIAAIHLKSTKSLQSEQIDEDIMRHRYATISELCEALNRDTDHKQILEATLGMIFFQCSVGGPEDSLPDIAWHQHFEAGASLVRKLELPHAMVHSGDNATMRPPFNMTLTSWIDILGATMIARSPVFAHIYREKNEAGSMSGLCELMGCEDNIMYLISEIACLDGLKTTGGIDDMQLCGHVQTLSEFVNQTEPPFGLLDHPYSSSGAIRPKQLSTNMTAVFRIAARIYLCSLVPGASKHNDPMLNLIDRFASAMGYIPSGPDGFDRSLVWPLLIAGSMSTPGSLFRQMFANRIASLGEHAGFGSFGRMVRLLQEVWRQSGEDGTITFSGTVAPTTDETRNVHWRDVMQQKGWDFLLI